MEIELPGPGGQRVQRVAVMRRYSISQQATSGSTDQQAQQSAASSSSTGASAPSAPSGGKASRSGKAQKHSTGNAGVDSILRQPPEAHSTEKQTVQANAFGDQRLGQRPYGRRDDREAVQNPSDSRDPYRDDGKGNSPYTDRRDKASFAQPESARTGRAHSAESSPYKDAAPADPFSEPGSVRGEAPINVDRDSSTPRATANTITCVPASGEFIQRRSLHTYTLAALLTGLGVRPFHSHSGSDWLKQCPSPQQNGQPQDKQRQQQGSEQQRASFTSNVDAQSKSDGVYAHPDPAPPAPEALAHQGFRTYSQASDSDMNDYASGAGGSGGGKDAKHASDAFEPSIPFSQQHTQQSRPTQPHPEQPRVPDPTAGGHRTGSSVRSANPYGDHLEANKNPYHLGNYPYPVPDKGPESRSDCVAESPLGQSDMRKQATVSESTYTDADRQRGAAQAARDAKQRAETGTVTSTKDSKPSIVLSSGPDTIPGILIAPINVHGRAGEQPPWHPAAADQAPLIGIPVTPVDDATKSTSLSSATTSKTSGASAASSESPSGVIDDVDERSKKVLSKMGLKPSDKPWRPEDPKH
jgi:hypothetical protein